MRSRGPQPRDGKMAPMTQSPPHVDSPVICPLQKVEPAWIDYNGHLNMAFYHVLFDRALDYVYDLLGVGESYVVSGGGSCFTLEVHVNYLRELINGEPVRITFQLLDFDTKRLHFFEHMYHGEEGHLVATSEQLALHVAMESRRAAEFPADALQRITRMFEQHRTLERPEQAGRAIGIRRKP